jgi:hypothetical protein
LHLRSRGLPGSLVLAGRILALGLILAGAALLSRRLRSAGLALLPARCRLLLSASALRGSAAATALPATGGKSPTLGAAASGEAAASTSASAASAASTSASRVHLAIEAQHEHARNECGPDSTP